MDFLGLLGAVSDAIDSQIESVIVWSTAQFGVLFGDIGQVNALFGDLTKHLASVFSVLWTWLHQLADWINRTIVQRLADLINRIHDWLKRIFGPLLKTLQQIRDRYRELWLRYVKPLYDFMQRVRSALVVFRLLGFKWAKALDARIVKLETALTDAFLATFKNLNRLADWINYIIDPTGIFQPSIWLRSIMQSIGAIIAIGVHQMSDPGFTAPGWVYSVPDGWITKSNMAARSHARAETGLLPEDQSVITSLRAAAAEIGY